MGISPAEFAAKWTANTTKEIAGSKEQFIDLCRMLGYPTPTEADPTGDFYAIDTENPARVRPSDVPANGSARMVAR